jgi:hypothetical protein
MNDLIWSLMLEIGFIFSFIVMIGLFLFVFIYESVSTSLLIKIPLLFLVSTLWIRIQLFYSYGHILNIKLSLLWAIIEAGLTIIIVFFLSKYQSELIPKTTYIIGSMIFSLRLGYLYNQIDNII